MLKILNVAVAAALVSTAAFAQTVTSPPPAPTEKSKSDARPAGTPAAPGQSSIPGGPRNDAEKSLDAATQGGGGGGGK